MKVIVSPIKTIISIAQTKYFVIVIVLKGGIDCKKVVIVKAVMKK